MDIPTHRNSRKQLPQGSVRIIDVCLQVERGAPGSWEPDLIQPPGGLDYHTREHAQSWFSNFWQTENWNKLLLQVWKEKKKTKLN